MEVTCIIITDDRPKHMVCRFVAVPRVGDTLTLPGGSKPREVTGVHHFCRAEGENGAPHVHVHLAEVKV